MKSYVVVSFLILLHNQLGMIVNLHILIMKNSVSRNNVRAFNDVGGYYE
jgi:hypothetical protein